MIEAALDEVRAKSCEESLTLGLFGTFTFGI